MTVVQPNSISGINSITVQSGEALSVHKADGTLIRTIVTDAGISTFSDVSIADKIIHTGDTNTAIRFPAADTVTIETAGTEALRVQSDGDVGIGTINNSNNERLRVQDDATTSTVCQVSIIAGNAERAVLNFGDKEDANIGRVTYDNSDNHLSLFTNNAEAFRITSGGLIGINTTAGTLLELKGESSKEADVTFNRQPVQGTNDGTIGQFIFENATDSVAQISVKRESAADDAYIQFATQATGGGLTERLRITSAGNLGIGGLTNPGALLSIPAGESNTPRLAIESAVDDNDFTITQYEDGNGTYTMLGQNVKLNSSGNTTVLDSAHKTAGVLLDARSNGNLTFYTGGDNVSAERLRITSAGSVGIGTDIPAGTLEVQKNGVPAIISNYNNSKHIQMGSGGSGAGFHLTSGNFFTINHQPYADKGTDNNLTERIRILSGGGITFNGDTATANALNDYEEGTWTPTALNFDGTITINSADYVKVGRLVHINMYISFSNTTDTSNVLLGGLPFTVGGDADNHYSLITAHSNGNIPDLALRAQGTTTQLTAVYLNSGDGDSKPDYNKVRGQFIIAGGTYYTT